MDEKIIKDIVARELERLIPIGSIQCFARADVSTMMEWLPCDGRTLKKADYRELFDVIGLTFGGKGGSFKLPDLRGQFIRGWDMDGNNDAERQFGSLQDDSIQGHSHTVKVSTAGDHCHKFGFHNNNTKEANAFYTSYTHKDAWDYENEFKTGDFDTSRAGRHKHEIVVGNPADFTCGKVRVATETRPKNIALLYCIRVK